MHIPFWKRWLSYVFPVSVEHTASSHNPELSVVLDRGRLQLLSGNAIYSWDDLYHNFTIAFGVLDIEQRPFHDVLLLGLGLGSVPYILEKIYDRSYHYTAIEWDETVVALATKYTFPRLESRIDTVIADAAMFVQVTEEQFDLIVVDIFEDDRTPARFETEEFLDCCKKLLTPNGILLYNRLYNNDRNRLATTRFFEHRFKTVFPEGKKLDTGGNWVLAGRIGDE